MEEVTNQLIYTNLLTAEFKRWSIENWLFEASSADELLRRDDITAEQREWLQDYIGRLAAAPELDLRIEQACQYGFESNYGIPSHVGGASWEVLVDTHPERTGHRLGP